MEKREREQEQRAWRGDLPGVNTAVAQWVPITSMNPEVCVCSSLLSLTELGRGLLRCSGSLELGNLSIWV